MEDKSNQTKLLVMITAAVFVLLLFMFPADWQLYHWYWDQKARLDIPPAGANGFWGNDWVSLLFSHAFHLVASVLVPVWNQVCESVTARVMMVPVLALAAGSIAGSFATSAKSGASASRADVQVKSKVRS